MKNNNTQVDAQIKRMLKHMYAGTSVLVEYNGSCREVSFDGAVLSHEDILIVFKALGWDDSCQLYFRRCSDYMVQVLDHEFRPFAIVSMEQARPFLNEEFAGFIVCECKDSDSRIIILGDESISEIPFIDGKPSLKDLKDLFRVLGWTDNNLEIWEGTDKLDMVVCENGVNAFTSKDYSKLINSQCNCLFFTSKEIKEEMAQFGK